jgi:hypothetical protein
MTLPFLFLASISVRNLENKQVIDTPTLVIHTQKFAHWEWDNLPIIRCDVDLRYIDYPNEGKTCDIHSEQSIVLKSRERNIQMLIEVD